LIIEEAMEVLKEKGYKLTEQRKAIVQLLLSQEKYVSAKDIYQKIQKKFPGVSFDTIYRNLSILSDLGIIEETQYAGEAKFITSCSGTHHHHLVCTNCGEIFILSDCPMDLLQTIAGNFQVTGHRFEIFGLCKDCQN